MFFFGLALYIYIFILFIYLKFSTDWIDQSIYGKYPLNPQKIATKGFSIDSVRF